MAAIIHSGKSKQQNLQLYRLYIAYKSYDLKTRLAGRCFVGFEGKGNRGTIPLCLKRQIPPDTC